MILKTLMELGMTKVYKMISMGISMMILKVIIPMVTIQMILTSTLIRKSVKNMIPEKIRLLTDQNIIHII